jgi:hypothetical protein
MKKVSVGDLASQIYSLLEELTAEERSRVLAATSMLFGDQVSLSQPTAQKSSFAEVGQRANQVGGVKEYFEDKQPKSKIEEMVIAARYRELNGFESNSKEDFKNVMQEGRRYFDSANFARDMDNATRRSGFFLPGMPRGVFQLSVYGQKFADILPNREDLKSIKNGKKVKKKTKTEPKEHKKEKEA